MRLPPVQGGGFLTEVWLAKPGHLFSLSSLLARAGTQAGLKFQFLLPEEMTKTSGLQIPPGPPQADRPTCFGPKFWSAAPR